jgi:GNAT superfamily N-acetyltransferase
MELSSGQSKLQTTSRQKWLMGIKVYRALESEIRTAYGIVDEYYRAASVVLREDRDAFAKQYFGSGRGVWLAEVDGEIVGSIALRSLPDKPGCAEIKRLYVRPSHRGQGLADLLLAALESYARASGYHWLYLDTARDMQAAVRFYQRQGFSSCETYNENPQAEIFMSKALG